MCVCLWHSSDIPCILVGQASVVILWSRWTLHVLASCVQCPCLHSYKNYYDYLLSEMLRSCPLSSADSDHLQNGAFRMVSILHSEYRRIPNGQDYAQNIPFGHCNTTPKSWWSDHPFPPSPFFFFFFLLHSIAYMWVTLRRLQKRTKLFSLYIVSQSHAQLVSLQHTSQRAEQLKKLRGWSWL